MKVYYISSGLQGCYLVRCLLPLQANGWDGDQTGMNPEQMTPENKARAAQDADIVVFHRPEDPNKLKLARILKGLGKKIVFDNDDTYKDDGGFKFNEFMDKERLEKGLNSVNETIDAFVKEADLVTCSTKFLKAEYEKLNPNVIVLPNCVDPFLYDEPLRNESDVVRIGITGSVAITSDLDILKPIVEKYHNDKRVKIVLLSMPPQKNDKYTRELYFDEYKFWESVDIEWQPFVPMHDYFRTLNELKLDMMIIPRAENYFNRCKSNLKFLESSMFEIPVVAQSFSTHDSPYEQNPEDTKYMLMATDFDSWVEQIEKLITNKQLRLEMGKKAHQYVLENYNIEDRGVDWEKAYATLL
mgnify:CR=1 FL=1